MQTSRGHGVIRPCQRPNRSKPRKLALNAPRRRVQTKTSRPAVVIPKDAIARFKPAVSSHHRAVNMTEDDRAKLFSSTIPLASSKIRQMEHFIMSM